MPWCPNCRAEYREGFTECSECRVPLVDELPDEQPARPQEQTELPAGMENPIAVYTAPSRTEAELFCEALRDEGIAAAAREATFEQLHKAYGGQSARYGMTILVDASQTARARELIEKMKRTLEENPVDEDELARLAEEQAMETPPQPMEDSASLKLLPVVLGVIVLALALLYFIAGR